MQPSTSSRRPRRGTARQHQGAALLTVEASPEGVPSSSHTGATEHHGVPTLVLRELEYTMMAATNLTDALIQALREAPRLLPVRAAYFYLVDENDTVRIVGPEAPDPAGSPPPDSAMVAEALTTLRPILLPASPTESVGETYIVPLLTRTDGGFQAIGAAAFIADVVKPFAQEDLLAGALLASQVAAAIHRRRLDEELEHHREVQRQLLAEVISAQEHERKRIAADIHNDILQILGYNLLKVEICQRYLELGDTERLRGEFDAMRLALEESIQLLREIIFQLRPSTLDQRGLLATIDAHLARFEAESGIPVQFNSRLGRRLAPHLETLVYRLVQEALANIRKHSGARSARIALEGRDDRVQVLIEDNGRGFHVDEAMDRSLAQGHIGLHSMRERAELAGGSLTIESRRNQGTRLIFSLPRTP